MPCAGVVGLTGGIACGKSTVSGVFSDLGVPVLDADLVARELVAPGQPALAKIVELFGKDMLHADHTLNRTRLRQRIFSHPLERQQLESLLHPLIYQQMWMQAAMLDTIYCIFSVPLLLETGQNAKLQRVLVVDCEPEIQRQRLADRDGCDSDEINQILAAQCDRQTRLAYADDVIHNNGDVSVVTQQVQALHQRYQQLFKAGA